MVLIWLTRVQENGVAKAIEAIYRDLEYAKSIIKPLPNAAETEGPLEKVTSLLHPLTSNESSPFRRSRNRSKGEEEHEKVEGREKSELNEGSEESWDVVSEGKGMSSPERA